MQSNKPKKGEGKEWKEIEYILSVNPRVEKEMVEAVVNSINSGEGALVCFQEVSLSALLRVLRRILLSLPSQILTAHHTSRVLAETVNSLVSVKSREEEKHVLYSKRIEIFRLLGKLPLHHKKMFNLLFSLFHSLSNKHPPFLEILSSFFTECVFPISVLNQVEYEEEISTLLLSLLINQFVPLHVSAEEDSSWSNSDFSDLESFLLPSRSTHTSSTHTPKQSIIKDKKKVRKKRFFSFEDSADRFSDDIPFNGLTVAEIEEVENVDFEEQRSHNNNNNHNNNSGNNNTSTNGLASSQKGNQKQSHQQKGYQRHRQISLEGESNQEGESEEKERVSEEEKSESEEEKESGEEESGEEKSESEEEKAGNEEALFK